MFERLLKQRLVRFFDKLDLLIPGQYGFRAGHSTDMAILDMVERVRKSWGEGSVSLGVFIDLKKAFDTVDHHILLQKLEHYGIRGQTLSLFTSYLEGRTQYVCYNGYESERGRVECGVPQGSVLGPLFFIVYVNDMVRVSKELELVLFADDTNIFVKGKNPQDLFAKVNKGLLELSKWFRCNKLTLNLKKTEYVYFGGQGGRVVPPGGIQIGGEQIRRVEGARFLGEWVDEGLRWTGHIEKVRGKVGRLVGVLGRTRAVLGGKQIHMLYNALVVPHLQYCLTVWGDFKEGRNLALGDSLLRYQKRLSGMIAQAKGRYHADPIMGHYGILKLGDMYRHQLRIYAWRFWNGRLPVSQAAMLSRAENTHGHNTRAAKNSMFLSTRDHRSVGYRVPKEWEALTPNLRQTKSLSSFKSKSKEEFTKAYKAFICVGRGCFVCGS